MISGSQLNELYARLSRCFSLHRIWVGNPARPGAGAMDACKMWGLILFTAAPAVLLIALRIVVDP